MLYTFDVHFNLPLNCPADMNPVFLLNIDHSFMPVGFEESAGTSQAISNCTQYMPQLEKLYVMLTDPLPVLKAMGHRESPLQEITALVSLWVSKIIHTTSARS